MPRHASRACAVLAFVLCASAATYVQGTLVLVQYTTRKTSPPFEGIGGPEWTGIVDTDLNQLTITSWVELPSAPHYYTPIGLPVVWKAYAADGSEYDITDAHFDEANGTFLIDDQFAFISSQTAREMAWLEGPWSMIVGYDFYPGWGGFAEMAPGGGHGEFRVDRHQVTNEVYDQTTMPQLPIAGSFFGAEGRLTASIIPNSDGPVAVPEVSAVWFGLGAMAIAASMGVWRRSRRARPAVGAGYACHIAGQASSGTLVLVRIAADH